MLTLQDLANNPLINAFIKKGNEHLGVMGYTDHGPLHIAVVSRVSREILLRLGYDERRAELAGMAAYLHDLGNVVNRNGHSQSGALMAFRILQDLGMDPEEIAVIVAAIGNHDEGSGHPVSEVAAALILADKSHVHRNRVRNPDVANFDIHDRVNFAVNHSILDIDEKAKTISMELSIDTSVCPVMEYFEIFLSRMLLCRRAAGFLKCEFELVINEVRLL